VQKGRGGENDLDPPISQDVPAATHEPTCRQWCRRVEKTHWHCSGGSEDFPTVFSDF